MPNSRPQGHPRCDEAVRAVTWPEFTDRGGPTLMYAEPIAVDPTPPSADMCLAWDNIGYASQLQRVPAKITNNELKTLPSTCNPQAYDHMHIPPTDLFKCPKAVLCEGHAWTSENFKTQP